MPTSPQPPAAEELVTSILRIQKDVHDIVTDVFQGYALKDVDALTRRVAELLTTARREEREELRGKIERIKLDMDTVVCDCGEPYKNSDVAGLVNNLLSLLTPKPE